MRYQGNEKMKAILLEHLRELLEQFSGILEDSTSILEESEPTAAFAWKFVYLVLGLGFY